MSAFLIVVIVVAVVGILALGTRFFRPRHAIEDLGQSPGGFERPEERSVRDRVSEDERDEPLPKRPLRARH